MHVVAGVPGSTHDLALFRDTSERLAQLIAQKPHQQPRAILADKGYIGFIPTDRARLHLLTPHKKPYQGSLTAVDTRENATVSSQRVVVENFFGRLSTKFHIMVRRWGFDDEYYPIIFEICCALVNFDIQHGSGGRLTDGDGKTYAKTLTHVGEKGKEATEHAADRVMRRRERRLDMRREQEQRDAEESFIPEDDEMRATAAFGKIPDSDSESD
jgi:hypothetical protein